jgi:hypothetical protein
VRHAEAAARLRDHNNQQNPHVGSRRTQSTVIVNMKQRIRGRVRFCLKFQAYFHVISQ